MIQQINKTFLFHIIFIASISLILNACGGGGGSGGSGSGSSNGSNGGGTTFTGDSLEGGAVTEISLDSNNSAVIEFDDISDTSQYTLMFYNYSDSGSTQAYQMGSNGSLSSESADQIVNRSLGLETEDISEDFHEMLREAEFDLDYDAYWDESDYMRSAQSEPDLSLGSQRTFKVLNSLSSSSLVTITAELRHISDALLVYVDTRDENALTDNELEEIFDEFDSKYDQLTNLVGTPPDIDSNDKVITVLTRETNTIGGSGAIVTGYFYAINQFPTSVYSESNEADMIVGAIPDPSGNHGVALSKDFMINNIYAGLFLHEVQHAINFANHYLDNDGPLESSFLNEGISHVVEDLEYDMESSGIENYSRVSTYLSSIDSVCMTCGSSLSQRGGTYLLLRYLYEQAEKGNLPGADDGETFLNRVTQRVQTGVENIITAAYGDDADVDSQFRYLMGQFGLAVLMSDTGLSSDDRLSLDGINLRECADDNRGTCLQGPTVNTTSTFPDTNTVSNSAVSYVVLEADDIQSLGGSMEVQFSSSAEGGLYMVQTGI